MRNRMILVTAAFASLGATPALAASGPFFSLSNTDFVVSISFLLFVAILLYFKVPGIIGGMLDKRADAIRGELAEARALREEAQSLLASYERKQKEVQAQAERIIATAREDAAGAAEQAKADIAHSVERRLAAADEQIASARDKAMREVRERAISVAVAAAGEVVSGQMTPERDAALVDAAIETVEARLH